MKIAISTLANLRNTKTLHSKSSENDPESVHATHESTVKRAFKRTRSHALFARDSQNSEEAFSRLRSKIIPSFDLELERALMRDV